MAGAHNSFSKTLGSHNVFGVERVLRLNFANDDSISL